MATTHEELRRALIQVKEEEVDIISFSWMRGRAMRRKNQTRIIVNCSDSSRSTSSTQRTSTKSWPNS